MKNTRMIMIDTQDDDLTPAIYQLLFSGELAEIRGNDLVYKFSPSWRSVEEVPDTSPAWEERNSRGGNNCFGGVGGKEAMISFCKNPCKLNEAYAEFLAHIKKKGWDGKEDILLSVWW